MYLNTTTLPEIGRLLSSQVAKVSMSQLGEDCILYHYLGAKRDGFYIDVGCFDPFTFSNTAALYELSGWSGLNIDANEDAIARFNDHRPRDVNVHSAVGLAEASMTFAKFQQGAVNSLDPHMIEAQKTTFGEPEMVTVGVRPLRDILAEHLSPGRPIDLLDVDAEGWDLDVLRSNDWARFRPGIVAVEAHGFDISNPRGDATFQFLQEQGYALASHAVVTSIYLDTRKA